jgi:RNA polymerase sigma-70 factor (ECF subfamily)
LDRDLVARAQRGDEAAFTELVERVGDRMYAVAYQILRDSGGADDALQQAMIDIWRKLPTLKDPERFVAWAYRIVVRATYGEVASRRRWLLRSTIATVAPAGEADHAAAVADQDELDGALRRLRPEQRAVLVLKHFAGLSNPEIATALDVPEGTVRSRLYYATTALRAALEAERRPAAAGAEP